MPPVRKNAYLFLAVTVQIKLLNKEAEDAFADLSTSLANEKAKDVINRQVNEFVSLYGSTSFAEKARKLASGKTMVMTSTAQADHKS